MLCHCALVFSGKRYLKHLGAIFQLQSIVLCRVIVLYTIIEHYKHSALMVYKWIALFEWMLLVSEDGRNQDGLFVQSFNGHGQLVVSG